MTAAATEKKTQPTSADRLKGRLVMTTAFATVAMFGYSGRVAHAGSCDGDSGTYVCRGPADAAGDTTQAFFNATGQLSVSTEAGFGIDARSRGFDAIYLYGQGGSTGLSFTDNHASDISAAQNGIRAQSRSGGETPISIQTTGRVTAVNGVGVSASSQSFGTGSDITISTADVTAGGSAIRASQRSDADLKIYSSGTLTAGTRSSNGYGVLAGNYGNTGTTTISVADVSATGTGIYLYNDSSGKVSITSTGTVTSGRTGVELYSYGGDATISTNVVSAVGDGIEVDHVGGALSITSTGKVSSETGSAISASLSGTNLHIAASDVTGYGTAIEARNNRTGTSYLSVDGAVEATTPIGGTGISIYTRQSNLNAFQVVLKDGASINTPSGMAIQNRDGASDILVQSGASVSGRIELAGGKDTLTFDGGDFSGVTAFDGGFGTEDALVLRNSDGTLDGSLVTGFETVEVGDGSALSLQNGLTATTFSVGEGGLISGSGTIDAAVAILAGGGVGPGNSPGILTINGDIDFTGGSFLDIELGGTTAGTEYDQLDVFGIATLGSGTIFNIDGFNGFGPTDGDIFDILVADTISLTALSDLTFNFNIGGNFNVGIFDVGGRHALRLTSVSAVPLPAGAVLYGSGFLFLLGMGWMKRRRRLEDA